MHRTARMPRRIGRHTKLQTILHEKDAAVKAAAKVRRMNREKKQRKPHRYASDLLWVIPPVFLLISALPLTFSDRRAALQCLLAGALLLALPGAACVAQMRVPFAFHLLYLLFIVGSTLLGELFGFYARIAAWDLILHTIAGILFAALGWSLAATTRNKPVPPLRAAFFAFCFAVTCSTFWEFFEYGADRLLMFDMQKDVLLPRISSQLLGGAVETRQTELCGHILPGYLDIGLCDTMEDMLMGAIGAAAFTLSFPHRRHGLGHLLVWRKKDG